MAGRPQFDPHAALEGAVRTFWERGFQATSVQDLENAMGIGRASIYNTFGSKEDLFLLALSSYVDRYAPQVVAAFDDNKGSAAAALGATFNAALARMSNPDLPAGCLVAQSTADVAELEPRTQAVVAELLRVQMATITAALAADVLTGRLEEHADTEALAAFFSGTIHSLSLMHRNAVTVDVLRRVAEHALDSLRVITSTA